MNLHNVAKMFDTCPVYDGYSGALLFKVQTSTFLESSLEGSTAARRVISAAPELVMPTHSCLLVLNELLIVGRGNSDEWGGTAIRKAYWVKVVTDNFKLLTPAEAILNGTGQQVLGQRKYLKELSNKPTESETDTGWEIFVSESLEPPAGYIFKGVTTYYRIRTSFSDVDGFRTCRCDELDSGPLVTTFTTDGVYDPVADSYGTSTAVSTGIPLPFDQAFSHKTSNDFKSEVGDIALLVAKSFATPSQGVQVDVAGSSKYSGTWRVVNVLDEHDAWNLHLRRR